MLYNVIQISKCICFIPAVIHSNRPRTGDGSVLQCRWVYTHVADMSVTLLLQYVGQDADQDLLSTQ